MRTLGTRSSVSCMGGRVSSQCHAFPFPRNAPSEPRFLIMAPITRPTVTITCHERRPLAWPPAAGEIFSNARKIPCHAVASCNCCLLKISQRHLRGPPDRFSKHFPLINLCPFFRLPTTVAHRKFCPLKFQLFVDTYNFHLLSMGKLLS